MTEFTDLAELPEDERIQFLGRKAQTKIVGVIVESDQPVKIKRYIRKVTERFPGVRLMKKAKGPTRDTVILKFGPKLT